MRTASRALKTYMLRDGKAADDHTAGAAHIAAHIPARLTHAAAVGAHGSDARAARRNTIAAPAACSA